jgi:hypothetical protein
MKSSLAPGMAAGEMFRRESTAFALRCTCESCGAFDAGRARCAYGYPTEPHRKLPTLPDEPFTFCKAFELT